MATQEPGLLSVVIPTHDRNDRLREAVQSVLSQTYSPLELIVVDDGSPTPAREAVQGLATDKIESVAVLRHQTNKGANAARNNGIRRARGEYIAFLDDDDLWHEEKAQQVVSTFESSDPEVGVVYTGTRYETGEMTSEVRPTTQEDVTKALLRGERFGQFSSITVRASVISEAGLPDERFPAWQDREWFFRLAQCCEFAPVREPLTIRRVDHRDRIQYRFEEMRDVAYPLFVEKHYPVAREHGRYYARWFIASLNVGLGTTALKCGNYRAARKCFVRACLANPFYSQPIIYLLATLFGKWSYRPSRYLKRRISLPTRAST